MVRFLTTLIAASLVFTGCTDSHGSAQQSSQEGAAPEASLSTTTTIAEVEQTVPLAEQLVAFDLEPVFVVDLKDSAIEAAIGYGLAVGELTGGQWTVDLEGFGAAADRAALGLLSIGAPFERSGPNNNVLSGPVDLLSVLAIAKMADFDAIAVVAAAAEVGGTPQGRLAAPLNSQASNLLRYFATTAGIALERSDVHGGELWFADLSSAALVAIQPVLCAENVVGIGGSGCLRPGTESVALTGEGLTASVWQSATTGALGPNPPLDPSSVEGGVSWNNNEAQSYRQSQVRDDDNLTLTALRLAAPSTELLPVESGMVVSREEYGFGTFAFEVDLPEGDGLWPAIWLLDAEACENPGRCAGYQSSQYHEIDVIEMKGSAPDEALLSVHWWDESIRSDSMAVQVQDLSSGLHVIELERRPGLLIWRVDGTEVHRVAGLVKASGVWGTAEGVNNAANDVIAMTEGPHRAFPMRIVINLAVGGSFAGDRLVGRDGSWWGDAMVPEDFPNLGWTTAEMVLSEVTFTPLG